MLHRESRLLCANCSRKQPQQSSVQQSGFALSGLVDPYLGCASLETEAAVVQVPLHGGTGLRYRVSADRIEDLLVLSLKYVDLSAIGEGCWSVAPRPPWHYEATEIFQYPLK
jgi:hypothetical protein